MTLDWLFARMAQWGDNPAVVWRDLPISYAELLERIVWWRQELGAHGVGPGQVVSLEGDYSPNACALLLALVDLNAIVVPLTPVFQAHRDAFLQIAEAQVTVGFDRGDGWAITRRAGEATNPLTHRVIDQGHPGLVIFSSGSTGRHKAVLHDAAVLLEKYRSPRRQCCTLTFLLLDHIGGIDTLLTTLANGGSVVTVPNRDPETVCRAIALHRVQVLPASATFLNLLLISGLYQTYDLSSLELIAYGSEPMPESTLLRLNAALPHVKLLQTYGLSEMGVLHSHSKDSASLWLKVGGEGFETKIVDGTLWIRARSAMLGYLNAPNPVDAEGWFNTQDAVEVDGEYIRVLGRRTEIINVGGQKVYPAEVESVLLQMDNVREVAVYGERNPLTGQIVVARVNLGEPEDPGLFKQRLRAFVRGRLANYKIPVKIELVDQDQYNLRFKKVRGGGAQEPEARSQE